MKSLVRVLMILALGLMIAAVGVVVAQDTDTPLPPRLYDGDTVSGTINDENVSDTYRLVTKPDDNLVITMTRQGDDASLDPLLLLFDDAGDLVQRDDDSAGQLNAELRLTVPDGGLYTVVATRFGEEDGGSTGDYTLAVSFTDAAAVTTTRLAYGDRVSGSLDDTTFEQRYTFQGAQGDTVQIQMLRDEDADLRVDPYLVLVGPGGQSLAENDDGGEGLNAQIIFTLPQDGAYTIVATRFRQAEGFSSGPYTLSLNDIEALPVETQSLIYGDSVTGEIDDFTFEQRYTFQGNAGDAVIIDMARDDDDFSRLDTYLILLGPDGEEVARDDDGGEGFNSRLSIQLPADGQYTIVATRFRQADGASSGAFTLRLSEGEALPTPEPTPTGPPTNMPPPPPPPSGMPSLAYGQEVPGEIRDDTFEQRYVFEGRAGDNVLIDMQRANDDESFLDTYLILLGPDGDEIARDDDSGQGLNSQIQATLPVDGNYTIVATRFRQADGASEGAYTLRLSEGEALPTPEPTQEPTGPPPTGAFPTLSYGEEVTGDLSGDTFEQRYSFRGNAGDDIIIDMRRGDEGFLDTYLILLGPDGEEVARDDDSGEGFNALLEADLPADGDYTIVATRYRQEDGGSQGDYILRLSQGDGPPPLPPSIPEPEPRGDNRLTYGDTAQGNIGGDRFEERYTFQGDASDNVLITMSRPEGVDRGLDSYLILLGPDGQEVARDDDGGGNLNSRLGITLQDSGEYTIVATRFQQENGGSEGDYVLALESVAVEDVSPQPIEYGETVRGEISEFAGEREYFFQGAEGDNVVVEMVAAGNGRLDPYLILLDPNGQEVTRNDDYQSLNSRLTARLRMEGEYTIVATRCCPPGGSSAGPFDLTLTLFDLDQFDAQPLELGETAQGSITDENAEQYYIFEGEAGAVITISMTGERPGTPDTYLTLFDDSGTQIAFNDDYQSLNSRILTRLPRDGQYLIEASRFGGQDGSSAGDYMLVVQFAPSLELGVPIEGRLFVEEPAPTYIFQPDTSGDYRFTYRLVRGAGPGFRVSQLADEMGGFQQDTLMIFGEGLREGVAVVELQAGQAYVIEPGATDIGIMSMLDTQDVLFLLRVESAIPTPTPMPSPTYTPTPLPVTPTPEPSNTLAPTSTPEPTETRAPSSTPEPTDTLAPTSTPLPPTEAPEATEDIDL